MYYRVADAESAVNNVDDYAESARLIASTTLRNVLGTKTLGSILSGSDAIAKEIKAELDLATTPWGVQVERVEVKDVSVPEQLQRSLASEAEARRNARAKVSNIQFNANQMNKSRARIEFVEFYTGPAFIHLVCIKLYI